MAINLDVTYDGNTIATLENQASVPIIYNNATIATLSAAGTNTIACANKLMATDLIIGDKTLACAGKVMSSNIGLTATAASTRLYLFGGDPIDECLSVTRKWAASSIRYTSEGNATQNTPTISTDSTGKYRTVRNGTSSSGSNMLQGAYVAGETTSQGAVLGMITDLTGYSKIVLEYDLVTTGTNSDYRKFQVHLFASKSWCWASQYQTNATNKVTSSLYKAGVTLTDQKLELPISNTGGYVQVGIGVNERTNRGVIGTVTIKALYAEP